MTETLVPDPRGALTPADLVEAKLLRLLGGAAPLSAYTHRRLRMEG